jgi:hypothetical protein
VIVTVLLVTPTPETVTDATLGFDVVLAAAVTVMVLLFDPEELLNVNQLWLLLAVQFMLDVIVNVEVLFAAAFMLIVAGDTANDEAAA